MVKGPVPFGSSALEDVGGKARHPADLAPVAARERS
jgi:hypothetical protein